MMLLFSPFNFRILSIFHRYEIIIYSKHIYNSSIYLNYSWIRYRVLRIIQFIKCLDIIIFIFVSDKFSASEYEIDEWIISKYRESIPGLLSFISQVISLNYIIIFLFRWYLYRIFADRPSQTRILKL